MLKTLKIPYLVEILRRSDESGISRVDSRVLDVLAHGHHQHFALECDGVDIDFLGVAEKLQVRECRKKKAMANLKLPFPRVF